MMRSWLAFGQRRQQAQIGLSHRLAWPTLSGLPSHLRRSKFNQNSHLNSNHYFLETFNKVYMNYERFCLALGSLWLFGPLEPSARQARYT